MEKRPWVTIDHMHRLGNYNLSPISVTRCPSIAVTKAKDLIYGNPVCRERRKDRFPAQFIIQPQEGSAISIQVEGVIIELQVCILGLYFDHFN